MYDCAPVSFVLQEVKFLHSS